MRAAAAGNPPLLILDTDPLMTAAWAEMLFGEVPGVLLGYRRIENWVIWIVVDVAAVLLYINRGLYPTAGLYGGMLVMSLFGLKEWIEAERRQRDLA